MNDKKEDSILHRNSLQFHNSKFDNLNIYKISDDYVKSLKNPKDDLVKNILDEVCRKEGVREKIHMMDWKEKDKVSIYTYWWLVNEPSTVDEDTCFDFLKVVLEDVDSYNQIIQESEKISKGLIALCEYENIYYLVTFGGASLLVTHFNFIESRFGIELTKKLIGEKGVIKEINQKEFSKLGKNIDTIIRKLLKNNDYLPVLDFDNSYRVLRSLSGKVDVSAMFSDPKDIYNPHYSGIGKMGLSFSSTGKDSLHLTAKPINRHLFTTLVKKIYDFDEGHLKSVPGKSIPELEEINEKKDEHLYNNLKTEFDKAILHGDDLFINTNSVMEMMTDLENIDQIIVYDNTSNKEYFNESGIPEVLMEMLADKIDLKTFLGGLLNIHIGLYSKNVRSHSVVLSYFIEGQMEFNSTVFLRYEDSYYRPNADFEKLVARKFESIFDSQILLNQIDNEYLCSWQDIITALQNEKVGGTSKLDMHYRDKITKGGFKINEEKAFNENHVYHNRLGRDDLASAISVKHKFYCLDRQLSNKIEICDLFLKVSENSSNSYFLIHTKKISGNEIRELFSQGRTSYDYILDHESRIDGPSAKIKEITGQKVSNPDLAKRSTIIFAIYPKVESYRKDVYTADDAKKFFSRSLYTKYELVSTYQYLKNIKGVDMKLYFIRK